MGIDRTMAGGRKIPYGRVTVGRRASYGPQGRGDPASGSTMGIAGPMAGGKKVPCGRTTNGHRGAVGPQGRVGPADETGMGVERVLVGGKSGPCGRTLFGRRGAAGPQGSRDRLDVIVMGIECNLVGPVVRGGHDSSAFSTSSGSWSRVSTPCSVIAASSFSNRSAAASFCRANSRRSLAANRQSSRVNFPWNL